jgi:hypothetical protein
MMYRAHYCGECGQPLDGRTHLDGTLACEGGDTFCEGCGEALDRNLECRGECLAERYAGRVEAMREEAWERWQA